MDPAMVMELISVQRHDFLNHLQVISGLLQLNRVEQAGEYIKSTARNITRLSRVVHLAIPDAAAAVLLAHHGAAERGVEVEYRVDADLNGCLVPGDKLGPLLETVLLHAVECLAGSGHGDRRLHVDIDSLEGGYGFRIRFEMPGDGRDGCGEEILEESAAKLAGYRGTLQWDRRDDMMKISIFLPAD